MAAKGGREWCTAVTVPPRRRRGGKAAGEKEKGVRGGGESVAGGRGGWTQMLLEERDLYQVPKIPARRPAGMDDEQEQSNDGWLCA
jgi:hypothetical protein